MNLIYTLMPLLSGIFWGTSGTFVRTMADEHWDNMTILYGRMLTAVSSCWAVRSSPWA